MNPPCVFCLILAGEIPSLRVHEDDATLAFLDIHPVHPGHTLVIPKAHHANVFELPPELIARTAQTAQRIARAVQAAFAPPGLNLLQCNGPAAAQSVEHFHVHVIPRAMEDGMRMNWAQTPGDHAALQEAAERIRRALADAA
jgi:histidine triad (HIT) family protein